METPNWLHPNLGEPNPKLEEEARELGQFMIELAGGYHQLEHLRKINAPQDRIDDWLDDIAISTRGIRQTTERIAELVREEGRRKWAAIDSSVLKQAEIDL